MTTSQEGLLCPTGPGVGEMQRPLHEGHLSFLNNDGGSNETQTPEGSGLKDIFFLGGRCILCMATKFLSKELIQGTKQLERPRGENIHIRSLI